jgi:diguanylate cyclase (GGDEF)-like protein
MPSSPRPRPPAVRDPLTGLAPLAAFTEALAHARRHAEVAVLAIDVDGFRALNHERGHQAGNRVLVGVAAALSSALRQGDELFRIVDDEFAAIVTVRERGEADHIARRLRESVAATGGVTVSIGVALPRLNEPGEDVLPRAERTLLGD